MNVDTDIPLIRPFDPLAGISQPLPGEPYGSPNQPHLKRRVFYPENMSVSEEQMKSLTVGEILLVVGDVERVIMGEIVVSNRL